MIQEIFKGNTPSSSPLSSSTNSNSENIRCPRCDSPNTKFCYYNNYNLTQPRHFCKTCRRYWTKGGALRNVPIGGGCRKNKHNSSSITTKSSVAKLKLASLPFEINGKAGIFGGYEQEIVPNSTNPSIFGYTQNHHPLLSLLRGNQNPKSSFGYKEEQDMFGCGGILDGKSQGIISYNNHELIPCNEHGQDESRRGLEEIYQRLKASTASRSSSYVDQPSSLSMILDSTTIPHVASQLGFWNNPTWSDHLPTTNGAFL